MFVARDDPAALASAVDGRTAAVIVEPVQGLAGAYDLSRDYLVAAARACERTGALLILDEVQTGMGRLGAPFGANLFGITPHLLTTAKGIAGGLPLAGVTGRAELMDSVHVGGLGGTYGGNPVACAAALGAIAEMREHALDARALEIGVLIRGRLEKLAAEHPVIGDVRGRGAMQAIELCAPGTTTPDAARAAAVSAYCHRNGVVTLTCGTWGNVIRFLPPLAISDALLEEALDVVADAFAATA